jgi:transcriptional regulator with XRE-family HTH domain
MAGQQERDELQEKLAMPAQMTPTVRLRQLGRQLRKLRESSGMTLDEAGRRLERTPSSLSKIETGRVAVRVRDLRVILDIYGLEDETRRNVSLPSPATPANADGGRTTATSCHGHTRSS